MMMLSLGSLILGRWKEVAFPGYSRKNFNSYMVGRVARNFTDIWFASSPIPYSFDYIGIHAQFEHIDPICICRPSLYIGPYNVTRGPYVVNNGEPISFPANMFSVTFAELRDSTVEDLKVEQKHKELPVRGNLFSFMNPKLLGPGNNDEK